MTRPARDQRGRFIPGRSPNPQGRPRGIVDRRRALRERIEKHADELVRLAMKAARGGDLSALSMLLSRAVAVPRAAAEPVKFEMPEDGNLADAGRAVLAEVAAGRIPPAEAKTLLDAIGAVAELVEHAELTARVAALESESRGNANDR